MLINIVINHFIKICLGLSGTVFHTPPAKLARVGDIVGDLMRKVNVSYFKYCYY